MPLQGFINCFQYGNSVKIVLSLVFIMSVAITLDLLFKIYFICYNFSVTRIASILIYLRSQQIIQSSLGLEYLVC